MNRRDFLKITAPLSLSPLLINGMPAKGLMNLLDFNEILTTNDFEDRKVVIIQMRGGCDFLNSLVPTEQYDNYVAARPTIHLPQSSLITLDSTLQANQRIGLNPKLQAIKALYDEGKVNIVNGVGYESPNYSHFRSTDLIMSAKNGNYTDAVREGWFAEYLASVFPGFSGKPTNNYPHPLGVQIGAAAESIGYRHQILHNVGINITNLANTNLYQNFSDLDENHYQELLDYIKYIDFASDSYNTIIENTFNNGTNSFTYPNDYLGKQLKTIGKLISGGLESKIFLADMNGFDNHINQVAGTGSDAVNGNHANLLYSFSQGVYALQKDMEAQGLADKVVIITISEFGRKIEENGNLGTDHGDLSSWFVIGKGVNPGISGRNVDISSAMIDSAGRTKDVLQHDYRRYLSTVIQDWLGNTDDVLSQVETGTGDSLLQYAGDLKLDLFKDDYKVPEDELLDDFDKFDLIVRELVPVTTQDGWIYYGETADATDFHFAIQHNPSGGNTQNISPFVTTYELINDGGGNRYFHKIESIEANYMLGNFWNIDLQGDSLNGFVNIRFFVDPERITELNSVAQNFKDEKGTPYRSNMLWIKTTNQFMNVGEQITFRGLNVPILGLPIPTEGTYNGKSYLQFDNVDSISGIGGAGSIRVLEANKDQFDYPSNPVGGMLIYNKYKGKIQGYTGTEWVDLN